MDLNPFSKKLNRKKTDTPFSSLAPPACIPLWLLLIPQSLFTSKYMPGLPACQAPRCLAHSFHWAQADTFWRVPTQPFLKYWGETQPLPILLLKKNEVGVPGGSVAKNPPANAGERGGSGKIPHGLEQLSLCTATTEPVLKSPGVATTEPACCNYRAHMLQLLKPTCPTAHVPQQVKPPQWEALRKSTPGESLQDPAQPNKWINNFKRKKNEVGLHGPTMWWNSN